MKNKGFISICILVVILFLLTPIITAIPIQKSTKTEKQNGYETTPIFNNNLKFIKGKILNLTEHRCGYSLPWFTFNCEDVYCILSFRNRPLIQHFVDKEQFTVAPFVFYGSITKSSINGFVYPWFWFNF